MSINEKGEFKFKVNEETVRLKRPGLPKNMYQSSQRTEIYSDKWKKTFRKTTANELANIIKDTTITQNSLMRITGSYSTKMLANLKLNNELMSGIEHRPSKTFFNKKLNLDEAINNNMLSYIPYAINYINSLMEEEQDKLYLDNFTILNKNLYFSMFLTQNTLINTECIFLEQKDVLTGKIQTLGNSKHLKIFITDTYNSKSGLNMVINNLKEDFIFITINHSFKVMYLSIYSNNTIIQFTKENLMALKNKHDRQNNEDLYINVKEKYEFERKIIGGKEDEQKQ
ncbi:MULTISPECIES: hypothetical protein [Vagococcus]|uniref:Uncharacterized protein n=1 Tax=Vagococcus fluvialis bH819 TaxID=1255619 RepID=A0A1X6WPU7_9ENTE|nr:MULTISPECIES: hypothetical protein [Vagococcus]SLM86361.1 hypothetical protein FM121_09740 [Vagococcus fluvialis bH819]HCM89015.1 hypothetical protein [Vagococcus sp.]